MKTAVLISGHMRSFDRCLPNLHWMVFRHLGEVDFFVSTVKDADAPKAELLRAKYPESRVEIEVVDAQPDCVEEMRGKGVALPAEWHRGQPYTHEPYPISVHPQGVLRQLWQLERAWNLFAPAAGDYEMVVRCRPDLWFHSLDMTRLLSLLVSDKPGVFKGGCERLVTTPAWGTFGGLNDRFAFLGTDAAKAYCTTYSQIPALTAAGCPVHPESLIHAAIEANDCAHDDSLRAFFSTLRVNGEMRPPEITTTDLLMPR